MEGGHSVPRVVTTKTGFGSGIVIPEYEKCKELGVEVRTRQYVSTIIRDDKGAVLGLKVQAGYRFPKADSGKTRFYRALKGVILCHGGFSRPKKRNVPLKSS